jgi:hypothetical protein
MAWAYMGVNGQSWCFCGEHWELPASAEGQGWPVADYRASSVDLVGYVGRPVRTLIASVSCPFPQGKVM